ncbi:MAG TPA: hypothetical protein VFK20_07665 [Vicinamibacterales bacterium]|nr:hypothetical protein [Vicinamibacterales bacterium]
MSLRIGFDMDGVLADFAGAYREIELRLFGPAKGNTRAGSPEEEAAAVAEADEAAEEAASAGDAARALAAREDDLASARESRRRRDVVWRAIQATPDFWTTLKPIDEDAVRRIHALMGAHRWEVFFITQRPATDGDTVQRQTQRWLVEQGFDLPSVLVIPGSRGAAAGALHLHYHVDDRPQNCIDVKAESSAHPLLIADLSDEITVASARTLGIGVARSIGDCLDILEQASIARAQPSLLDRLARLVGWKS